MLSSSTSAPTQTAGPPPAPATARRPPQPPQPGLRARWERFWREGLPAIWASAAMLLCIVTMLVTILVLTLVRGLGQFWAQPLLRLESTSGTFLGTVQSTEAPPAGVAGERVQLRIGNRDLYGLDFRWFEPGEIS